MTSAKQENYPSLDLPANELQISEKHFYTAQKFLDLFNYEITTITVRQDRKQRTWPGKIIWTGKEGSSSTSFKGSLVGAGDRIKTIREDIILTQNQGMSLWFMVNEGDGKVHEGKLIERSQASVKYLTACYVDTDEGDVAALEDFCEAHSCPPSIKVESSPGKYHVYFLFDQKLEPTKDNLLKWDAIQRKFSSLDSNYDKSMSDYGKLLRVAFFYHNKKKPHLVKAKVSDARYELDELYELTEAYTHVRMNGQGERFKFPEEKINSGNRHYTMMSYLRHLTNKAPDLSETDLLNVATGFARNYFEDYKRFMPGGERHGDVVRNVSSTLNYQREEQEAEALENLDEIKKTDSSNPFHLDPQFFYDCPTKEIGEMVKHSVSGALYPCPAYDFAAIVALLGHCKSQIFKSSRGHPPVNYFLCFGPSGVGKNHSQQIVYQALLQLGEVDSYVATLKTEKGLYRGLASSHGRYLVMMDEIEGLLSMLTADGPAGMRVESYTKSLKDALLRLYTSYDRRFTSALTGNEKDRPYVIDNPHLNLLGYGTPTALTHGFSVKSISDGLLPRFTILSVPDVRTVNKNADPKTRLTADHLTFIRDVMMDGRCKTEESLNELSELTEEAGEIKSSKGRKTEKERARLEEISERLVEISTAGRITGAQKIIPFSEKATKRYERLIAEMDGAYNAAGSSATKALYTRVAEKVGRLATVIATKEISTTILDYCIEFARHQLKAELSACGTSGERLNGSYNYEERQYQRLKECIEKMATPSQPTVPKRDLSRSLNLGTTLLGKLLELGLEREEIGKTSTKPKKGPSKEAYYLKSELN